MSVPLVQPVVAGSVSVPPDRRIAMEVAWTRVVTPTTVEAAAMAALPVQPARTASVSVPPVRPIAMEPAPTQVVITITVAPVAMSARVVQLVREAYVSAQEVPRSVAAAAAQVGPAVMETAPIPIAITATVVPVATPAR